MLQAVKNVATNSLNWILSLFKSADPKKSYLKTLISEIKLFFFDMMFPVRNIKGKVSLDRNLLIYFAFFTSVFLIIYFAYAIYLYFSQKDERLLRSIYKIALFPPVVLISQYAFFFDLPLAGTSFYSNIPGLNFSLYSVLVLQTTVSLLMSFYTIYNAYQVKYKFILSTVQSASAIIAFGFAARYFKGLEIYRYLHIINIVFVLFYVYYLLGMQALDSDKISDKGEIKTYSKNFNSYSLPSKTYPNKTSSPTMNVQSQPKESSNNIQITFSSRNTPLNSVFSQHSYNSHLKSSIFDEFFAMSSLMDTVFDNSYNYRRFHLPRGYSSCKARRVFYL